FYSRAKSTYLKVSNEDQMALGLDEFKDFSIMMMYSDFMKCNLTGKATGYMKFLPEAMFGPPEKSYYLEANITDFPGVVSNAYGEGKSVFIPWKLGAEYQSKGNYMHRA